MHTVDKAQVNNEKPGTICIVGKYTGLSDDYLFEISALKHTAMAIDIKVEV